MIFHRHTIRLHGYDYSRRGWYFITICTRDRERLFGDIVNHQMIPNQDGQVVQHVWESLPNQFPIKLDAFQIMPNHVHGIVQIVGAHHDAPKTPQSLSIDRAIHESPLHIQKRSMLSQLVGYFKMNTTKLIHEHDPNQHVWQRNYYEHIIRSERAYHNIQLYILNNPVQWESDEYYTPHANAV